LRWIRTIRLGKQKEGEAHPKGTCIPEGPNFWGRLWAGGEWEAKGNRTNFLEPQFSLRCKWIRDK
jgi:hypothetical protein